MGQNSVCISHLQFADDTLLFCVAKRRVLTNIRRLLDYFQVLAGLKINYQNLESLSWEETECGQN